MTKSCCLFAVQFTGKGNCILLISDAVQFAVSSDLQLG